MQISTRDVKCLKKKKAQYNSGKNKRRLWIRVPTLLLCLLWGKFKCLILSSSLVNWSHKLKGDPNLVWFWMSQCKNAFTFLEHCLERKRQRQMNYVSDYIWPAKPNVFAVLCLCFEKIICWSLVLLLRFSSFNMHVNHLEIFFLRCKFLFSRSGVVPGSLHC